MDKKMLALLLAFGGGGGAAKIEIVEKQATDTAVTLEEDKFYIFPTMSTLTITCPTTGAYQFRFTSGTTPTTFSMAGIKLPLNFYVNKNSIYEISVFEGFATAAVWEA